VKLRDEAAAIFFEALTSRPVFGHTMPVPAAGTKEISKKELS
jgi:hypothetical protein